MAHALLIESKLPKFLWPYAISTAAHIRNRYFAQSINDTPIILLLITNQIYQSYMCFAQCFVLI